MGEKRNSRGFSPYRIEIDNVSSTWVWICIYSVLILGILVITGFDNYVEEMREYPWYEVAGMTYFGFVLPWYLTVVGGIALKTWPRERGYLLISPGSRFLHFCNLVFIGPSIVAVFLFILPMLQWAYGPKPTLFEFFTIVIFVVILQRWIARKGWKFLKWTAKALASGSQ